jgi:hypothetical protein
MGFFQRGLLLYLCLAIAMAFAAPQVVFNGDSPAENNLLSWFNVERNVTDNTLSISDNSSFGGAVDTDAEESFTATKSPLLGALDTLWQVFSWVGVIFKVIFSPIIVLTAPELNMPTAVIFVFAIPLTFLFIVGLIGWIRSGT